MTADYDWNRVELTQGNFTTAIYRLVANTQFNPRVSLVNNVQYDTVSRQLGWQSRFRWIVKPGNDIFLVYQHNWLSSTVPGAGLQTLSRTSASKVVYTFQF